MHLAARSNAAISAVDAAAGAAVPGAAPAFEALLSALENGALVLDARGRLLAINSAAQDAFEVQVALRPGYALPIAHLPAKLRAFHAAGAWPRRGDVWFDLTIAGEKRRFRLRIRPFGSDPHWLLEMIDHTETERLQRAAASSAQRASALQEVHEELCRSFEISEAEADELRERSQEQDALIHALLHRRPQHD